MKNFEAPEMEVMEIRVADVITTSNGTTIMPDDEF